MSLNFAAFAKWMHSPEHRYERVLGKLVALGNPFFQIESLYRFNAKFFPRWEPRYLVYEGALGLPRAGSPRCGPRASCGSRRARRAPGRQQRAAPPQHANLINLLRFATTPSVVACRSVRALASSSDCPVAPIPYGAPSQYSA